VAHSSEIRREISDAVLRRASNTRAFLSSHRVRMTRRTRELRVFLVPSEVADSA
jgi:hypothetical protein